VSFGWNVHPRPSLTHLNNHSSQPLAGVMPSSQHVYEIRPRKDKRGVDLISDALPYGRLWYVEPNAISNAANYAKFFSQPSRFELKISFFTI
jgi:hypothetical protein